MPLPGFGNSLAQGVKKAVAKKGALGIFTGGPESAAGGITAAIFFGYLVSVFCKPQEK